MALFARAGLAQSKPRPPASLGWLGTYDGNIIGGLMIGFGMALTGACPGTVLVQLVTGVRSGWAVFAGGLLGGVLYSRLSGSFRGKRPTAAVEADKLALHTKFGIDTRRAILAYEAACLALITLVTVFGPKSPFVPVHPLIGGVLIGGAQAASLLLTGNPVGVSTAYEQAGWYFWRAYNSVLGRGPKDTPPPSTKSVFFATGIAAGSWLMAQSLPFVAAETGSQVSLARGLMGGCIMVLGARLAGGCTSGHGISGMSLLSVASIITVASMFAGGIGLAAVIL